MSSTAAETIHDTLTDIDERRVGDDLPEGVVEQQPRNFLLHVASLSATKIGDGLADPKLVLSWLLGTLGAPAMAIGLLVPVRESLALLPQIFTAPMISTLRFKRWAWVGGSAVQGLCVLAMAWAALTLEGAAAGWTIVGLLALFALARSICSVSYKDILGKTVVEPSRGTATGTAGSAAAIATLTFGALVAIGIIPLSVQAISVVLMAAGCLWLAGAVLLSNLYEPASEQTADVATKPALIAQFDILRKDPQLLRFIAARGLLTATALAPPFILALAGRGGNADALTNLGPFVIASALAAVLSSYVWGRLSDRSTSLVLVAAGASACGVLAIIAALPTIAPSAAQATYVMAPALFVLMVSYQGVRVGRSTHLVNMAPEAERAQYTAVSNTLIGVVLIAGGFFGVLAEWLGEAGVLAIFAGMSGAGAVIAIGLKTAADAGGDR